MMRAMRWGWGMALVLFLWLPSEPASSSSLHLRSHRKARSLPHPCPSSASIPLGSRHQLRLRGGEGRDLEGMMCIHDMLGLKRPDPSDFDYGAEVTRAEESQGAAASAWRFLAGGWNGWDLLMQHAEFKTTIGIFAWTWDGVFRFMTVREDEAKYCFEDGSVIECLWWPHENITGVKVTRTQEEQDWYFVESLLMDMDEGHGVRMRDHGIDFGVHWRFRPLGDYILGTHAERSVEIWLTAEGFVAIGEQGTDRGVIVKGGVMRREVSRAEAEGEISDIEGLRRLLAEDDGGFEAEFYGPHREMLSERGRIEVEEEGGFSSISSSQEDISSVSDPDWDAPGPLVDTPGQDLALPPLGEDREAQGYEVDEEGERCKDDPLRYDWGSWAERKLGGTEEMKRQYDQLGHGDGVGVVELRDEPYTREDIERRVQEIHDQYKYLENHVEAARYRPRGPDDFAKWVARAGGGRVSQGRGGGGRDGGGVGGGDGVAADTQGGLRGEEGGGNASDHGEGGGHPTSVGDGGEGAGL